MRLSHDPSQPPGRDVSAEAVVEGQGLKFGTAAVEYERGRPSYPREAAEWMLGDARTVVDLGAGTGKFTRTLVELGLDVTAVEPDKGMLSVLREQSPSVHALIGSAESIPLPDSSVDALTVAQAWHWFDLDIAVPEVARVLRPGGVLGLIWNVRDESAQWVAELGDLIHRGGSQDVGVESPTVGEPFGDLERRDFPWVHVVTLQQFLDMIASRSYVIAMSESERAAVLDEATDHVLSHPGQTREQIRVPYTTHAFRSVRSP